MASWIASSTDNVCCSCFAASIKLMGSYRYLSFAPPSSMMCNVECSFRVLILLAFSLGHASANNCSAPPSYGFFFSSKAIRYMLLHPCHTVHCWRVGACFSVISDLAWIHRTAELHKAVISFNQTWFTQARGLDVARMITGFILAASAGAGAHATNGKHARENVTERRNWEDSNAYGHFKPTSLSKWQD